MIEKGYLEMAREYLSSLMQNNEQLNELDAKEISLRISKTSSNDLLPEIILVQRTPPVLEVAATPIVTDEIKKYYPLIVSNYRSQMTLGSTSYFSGFFKKTTPVALQISMEDVVNASSADLLGRVRDETLEQMVSFASKIQ